MKKENQIILQMTIAEWKVKHLRMYYFEHTLLFDRPRITSGDMNASLISHESFYINSRHFLFKLSRLLLSQGPLFSNVHYLRQLLYSKILITWLPG